LKSVELCSKVQQFQDSESQLGPGALRVQCAIIVRSWGREAMCKWLLSLLPNSFSLFPNSLPDPHSLLTYVQQRGLWSVWAELQQRGLYQCMVFSQLLYRLCPVSVLSLRFAHVQQRGLWVIPIPPHTQPTSRKL